MPLTRCSCMCAERETKRARERDRETERDRERERQKQKDCAPDVFPAALLLLYCCFTEEMEGARNQESARAVSSNFFFNFLIIIRYQETGVVADPSQDKGQRIPARLLNTRLVTAAA